MESQLRVAVAGDDALRESVTVTGWVPSVEPYYRANDVFVLPSREEGMSNALLEACAHGRVVVASDIPPNRAVLGDDYPLLFPVGNIEALADRLLTAADPAAARDEARKLVLARIPEFSVSSVSGRLERLIDAADRPRN